ncbi:hypothetical protein D0Z00_004475 [Geotrichum galactomycetum]|uniref:Uncharacterized protein n=1 Tax=Geotrichum galactomycetum TaxID=27317 RepID=A0ACB6UYC3_9ASCO|nr:hypothetical protein D0Z00_004475 [Geotrichum candidum]
MSSKFHSALSSIKTYLLKPRDPLVSERSHYSGRMIQYGYPMSGNRGGRPRHRREKKVPPPVLTPAELDELFPEQIYHVDPANSKCGSENVHNHENLASPAPAADADAGVSCGHEDTSSNDKQRCCSICIEEFVDGEHVRVLSCEHVFHADCIKLWLVERHAICPMCKFKFGRAEAETTISSH